MGSLILGRRVLSTAAISAARAPHSVWIGSPAVTVRFVGTVPLPADGGERTEKAAVTGSAGGKKDEKAVASYWGVSPPKIVKEDGTEWKWSCFKPWDTYSSNLSIDLKKHHVPITWGDKLARWTVKSLRWPTDIFFQPMNLDRPQNWAIWTWGC